MDRRAENNVNYQERAAEFAVGDIAVPYGMFQDQGGRVTAVWPAIGMVDIEFPSGNKRYPVEDVQHYNSEGVTIPPATDSVPGGQPTVSVPGGPYPSHTASAHRVARAFVKKSLYWTEKDRRYRQSQEEHANGRLGCPRCALDMKKAVYKRRSGASDRLFACPGCLFLIKDSDITVSRNGGV